MYSLKDQVAIITGGARGIGKGICEVFCKAGATVALWDVLDSGIETTNKISSDGGSIFFQKVDVTETQSVSNAVEEIISKYGKIDILINNAGLLHNGYFTDLDLAEQERMIAVNVLALTSITHLFANIMATRGKGCILNISSLAAWMAIPNQNVYAASKAYVLSFTQALADEMLANSSGVSVTALCPGYTATKMMDNPAQGAKLRIPPTMMMSAREVAEAGIKGCLSGKSVVVPGVANKITAAVVRLFSKRLLTKLVGSFYRSKMQ